MRSLRGLIFASIFLIPTILFGQLDKPVQSDNNSSIEESYAPLNINNWIYWQNYAGQTGSKSDKFKNGGIYPASEKTKAIYYDGLIFGCMLDVPDPYSRKRVVGQTYLRYFTPGWILDPGDSAGIPIPELDNPALRLYRFRRDAFLQPKSILQNDASSYFNLQDTTIPDSLIDSLYQIYLKDLEEWPAHLGAPYYDRNRNGQYDPYYDEPGLADADQVIWYVINDKVRFQTAEGIQFSRIGLEIQVTVWAYDTDFANFYDTIFKRFRIINKSGTNIDSAYFSYWVDADILDYSNDLVGCDSIRDYGYCYNSDNREGFEIYNPIPSAVGIVLLQGPAVPSSGDFALVDFERIQNFRNLPMTSFGYSYSGAEFNVLFPTDETTIDRFYNIIRGYMPAATGQYPFRHGAGPNRDQPTKFPLNGNPVDNTGDICTEESNPGPKDYNFFVSTGPFTMKPGETQEVVFAIVGGNSGPEGSYLQSLEELQKSIPVIKRFYESDMENTIPEGPFLDTIGTQDPDIPLFILGQNYPNPFNNETTLRFRLLGKMNVTFEIYNNLGQKIKTIFKGPGNIQEYTFKWDGKDSQGNIQPSGLYFVHLTDGLRTQAKKIILLK
jgi:hypothetical protein